MIELQTGVKITEKTITLKELFDYEFNELQENSFSMRTKSELNKDLDFMSKAMSGFVRELHNVVLYKNNLNEYVIVNKEEELYALKSFLDGGQSSIHLMDNKRYYYHNLEDTSIIDNININLSVFEGNPINCYCEMTYNSRINKSCHELLEIIFIGPWILDMKRYFKGRFNPASEFLKSKTSKKIPNLNLMSDFIQYKAKLYSMEKSEYIQSVFLNSNAIEEWEFYIENIDNIITYYEWEN